MTEKSDGGFPSAEHYYSAHPRSPSERGRLRFLYRGEILNFTVDRGVFAARELDPGTDLLIQSLEVGRSDRVLDLGCGWGAVGVAAAKAASEGRVVMVDINRRAVRLARENLAQNRLTNAEVRAGSMFEAVPGERFDVIAANPPYRIGRPQILALLREAPGFLTDHGHLWIVGKGSQGILYYQHKLTEEFPGTVEVVARGSGYRVLRASRAARPGDRTR
ncbi:MAG: class I SAM-dependent methyltransferase [Thermoplasmata archaeon]